MQKRHTNRERYFEEQAQTTRNYYIPYIKEYTGNLPNKVLEVGCGEGGNLLPFAELGCDVIGIDIAASRIEQAQNFFITKRQKGTFIASDIFLLKDLQKHFPLILIHDVIEHIDNKEQFLRNLKKYLSPNGMIFIAFYKRQNKLFHFHKTFCSEFDIINTKQNVHFTKVVSPIFQFCLSLHQFSIGAKVPFINKRD